MEINENKARYTKRQAKLRVRHKKVLAALIAGKTQRDALRDGGYPETTVRHAAHEVIAGMRKTVASELKRQLPIRKLVQVMVAGLDATRQEAFLDQKSGRVVLGPPQIDFDQRRRSAELLCKVLGLQQTRVEVAANDSAPTQLAETINIARRRIAEYESRAASNSITAEVVRVLPAACGPSPEMPVERAMVRQDAPGSIGSERGYEVPLSPGSGEG